MSAAAVKNELAKDAPDDQIVTWKKIFRRETTLLPTRSRCKVSAIRENLQKFVMKNTEQGP